MRRYEDGLPSVSSVPQPDEPDEEVKLEEQLVIKVKIGKDQFRIKIPVEVYEEFKSIARQEHKTVASLIGKSMTLLVAVTSQVNTPGTVIVGRQVDGTEKPIIIVL